MSARSVDGYRLEWLTSFLAVVDFGGFAAGADATYRSQPRVSTHVAQLERHLGVVLIDRHERPVRLTEAGIAFLEHARAVVRSLETGTASVQAVLGMLRGQVRLGTYPSAGPGFVAGALDSFRRLHPHIEVELAESDPDDLAAALRAGDIDLALRPVLPAVRDASLLYQTLWEEPIVALTPPGHPLAASEYISVAELATHPLVLLGDARPDPEHPDEVHRAFRTAGVSPRVVMRTREPAMLGGLVRRELGVGVCDLLSATWSPDLVAIPLMDSGNRRLVSVFWNSSRPMQPAARALMDLLVQVPVPAEVGAYQRRA